MSKNKSKKKKDEVPVIPKYRAENLIDSINGKIIEEKQSINKLMDKLYQKNLEYHNQEKKYEEEAKSVSKILDNNTKINLVLNKEIKEIREERELFEKDCKMNFEKQFDKVQEEKKKAIKEITDEMAGVKVNLELVNKEKKKLMEKVEQLELEIQRLNLVNTDTIQKYENEIKEINEKHSNKLKQTSDIFEKFLENNKELLTTDLYTDYRELKSKFEAKKKESIDYRNKNNALYEQNKMFRLSMSNNDGIINECAKAQVEAKKKNKRLQEQIEQKDKIIQQMKLDYQSQISNINTKFTQLLQDNENEIQSLKNELNDKSRRLKSIQQTSQSAMKARTDLEIFFIEQLQECKIEIAKKKRLEEERKKNVFPFLNMSVSSQFNNFSGSTDDDSLFLTTAKKVEIKDIEPEYKEKLLRNLLNKLNEQNIKKSINFENIKDNS
jgi:hypothetical protein